MPENKFNPGKNWLNCLQIEGYRLTRQRRAVVSALSISQRALSPTQIFDLARKTYSSLGLVSVYRTIEILETQELIQRVHQPNGCHTYIASLRRHQHLLICRDCGTTDYFDGDNLKLLITRVENQSGFQINEHWLQLFGLCESCQ